MSTGFPCGAVVGRSFPSPVEPGSGLDIRKDHAFLHLPALLRFRHGEGESFGVGRSVEGPVVARRVDPRLTPSVLFVEDAQAHPRPALGRQTTRSVRPPHGHRAPSWYRFRPRPPSHVQVPTRRARSRGRSRSRCGAGIDQSVVHRPRARYRVLAVFPTARPADNPDGSARYSGATRPESTDEAGDGGPVMDIPQERKLVTEIRGHGRASGSRGATPPSPAGSRTSIRS